MTTATAPLPLVAGSWAVDQFHSSIGFTIRHLGISKVRGTFAAFTADVRIGDSLETTSVSASIDLTSIDTGNADRDAHTQQPDIIDVAVRPRIDFTSTSIVADGDGYRLDGNATIGDVTAPLSLAVELGGLQASPQGGPRHAGFEARGELRRSDYGIAPGIPSAMLGDVIKIELDLQLLEPERA